MCLSQVGFSFLLETSHERIRNACAKYEQLTFVAEISVASSGQSFHELYAYVTRRLFHINAQNDLEALDEVTTLMKDIAQAWQTLPGLLGSSSQSGFCVLGGLLLLQTAVTDNLLFSTLHVPWAD